MADSDNNEKNSRKAAQDIERRRRYEQLRRELAIRPRTASLKDRLVARYPGVNIMFACVGTNGYGVVQQAVEYRATREILLASGLAMDRMFASHRNKWGATTECGCRFNLRLAPGTSVLWDLTIYTEEWPTYEDAPSKKGLRDVAKLLQQFSVDRLATTKSR